MTVDYVMIGQITLDDTVLATGDVLRGLPGGGVVYAALGARVWTAGVGINAVVGREYPPENLDRLRAYGIDVAGVVHHPGASLRLWLLHEESDRKQQVPRLSSATFAELDAARGPLPDVYAQARAFHVAPSTPAGQQQALRVLRLLRPDAPVTLDILTAPYIATAPYKTGDVLRGVTAFLPSRAEVEALWGDAPLPDLIPRLAARYRLPIIAVKLAAEGSLLYDAARDRLLHIPIYRTLAPDPTGAGDAYCGGFLTGLAETGDPLEAALRGTVSASFAVEHIGALPPTLPSAAEAERRLACVRAGVTVIPRERS